MSLIAAAREFATLRHGEQRYGEQPYTAHLAAVAGLLHLAGCAQDGNLVIAAWLHDVVEDTETTIVEIRRQFGVPVSKLVWAVTGVGSNRKLRNADQYAKIAAFPEAALLKTADRISNLDSCVKPENQNLRLAQMYLAEEAEFRTRVIGFLPRTSVGDYLLARYEHAVAAAKAELSIGDA